MLHLQAQTAYELLRRQPGSLGFVFDELPIGVILVENSGALVMCNREAERIFGVRQSAVSPLEWLQKRRIYHSDQSTRYCPEDVPLARALRGEEVVKELMFVMSDTSADGLWIRANGKPLLNPDGTLSGAVAVFFDVTELRLAAERMNLLSLAVEQTADNILITDMSGRIEYVNPSFETTTGYSRPEILGRTPSILKSGQHDAAFYADVWTRILAGEIFRGTLVNRKKNGELYYAEQTIAPIRNSEGQMTHFVSVLKDVTALRNQQEQAIQLELARKLQMRLNAKAVSIPGLELGAVTLPTQETGGDYFDSIPTSKESVMIAVGDVSGHGLNAAMEMAMTRAYVRSACDHGLDVAAMLASINNMLCIDLDDEHYVTLMLAHFDLKKRLLTYASAGHIPAFLVDRSGRVQILGSTGMPLGLFKNRIFTRREIPIQVGHTLLMLTDGVTESEDSSDPEWIVEFVLSQPSSSAQKIADDICRSALARAKGDRQRDDITALVAKVAASR